MKITELYSKPVYDGNGYYIDDIDDVVIDIQPGRVTIIGITTQTLSEKKQMIPYTAIKAIGDIVILKDNK